MNAGVVLFNASESDCMLEGLPGIQLLDERKNAVAADIFSVCDEPGSACPPEYRALLVASRTHKESVLPGAVASLVWTTLEGPCASPVPEVFALDVSIAGGDVIVAVRPWWAMEPCGARVGVGRFESIAVAPDKFRPPPGLPTPTATPFIDHTVRPCSPNDLTGVFAGTNGLTGGQLLGYLAFGNRSGTACRLEGQPGVELLDTAGSPMVLAHTDFCFGAPCVAQPVIVAPHSDAIEPRKSTPGTALLVLYWPTYRVEGPPCGSQPAARAATVRVTLPDGVGTVDVPVGGDPVAPCNTLGIGVFQAVTATP